MKMPNYYETLNLANSASADEIKVSYSILTKMFGADQDMAKELNTAISILGDVASRAEYDRQMTAAMNKKAAQSELPVGLPQLPVFDKKKSVNKKIAAKVLSIEDTIAFNQRQRDSLNELRNDLSSKITAIACSIAIVACILGGIATNMDTLARLNLGFGDAAPSSYVRPATAPNGSAFPEKSDYIAGYNIGTNQGASSLMVVNSKNDNDVYLKLLSLDAAKPTIVRHVYIKGGSDFNLENLSPGRYEIQYLDLVAGQGGKSEIFTVAESKTEIGSEVSRLSLTLKTAVDGVLRVEKVSIEEFNSLASI